MKSQQISAKILLINVVYYSAPFPVFYYLKIWLVAY